MLHYLDRVGVEGKGCSLHSSDVVLIRDISRRKSHVMFDIVVVESGDFWQRGVGF